MRGEGRPTGGLLDPDGLGAGKVSHLLDIRKVEFAYLRPVRRRKHILLPGCAQQSLDSDLALRQCFGRAIPLPLLRSADPSPVDEHSRGAIVALEWSVNLVSVLALAHAGTDKNFLVVAESARGPDPPVVEFVWNCRRIDAWRQR